MALNGVESQNHKEGAWGVYRNGQLETTMRGYRCPNMSDVKFKILIDRVHSSKNLHTKK